MFVLTIQHKLFGREIEVFVSRSQMSCLRKLESFGDEIADMETYYDIMRNDKSIGKATIFQAVKLD